MRRRLPRWPQLAVILVVLLGTILAGSPARLATGPRPDLPPGPDGVVDRWSPPAPRVGPDFTTLDYHHGDGRRGVWVVTDRALPLRLVVEREVVDRFGLDAVRGALRSWNGVPGSRFAVEVAGVVDDGLDRKRRDGTSRVFLDRTSCSERFLARAHLFPDATRAPRRAPPVAYAREVDIGICARLTGERLPGVLRHEVGHAAGVGHLCEPDQECWASGMGTDNRCRVMHPAAYDCQELGSGDLAALVHLYPRVVPVTGATRAATAAAASYLQFPRRRGQNSAVLVAPDAPALLRFRAALLAAREHGPLLLAGERCTDGPTGRELNRATTTTARVVLVGDVSASCAATLRDGWDLQVRRLRDPRAVEEAANRRARDERLVLVGAQAGSAAEQATQAAAVALAGRRGAALMTVSGSSDAIADDVVARHRPREVVVVGGPESVPLDVDDALRGRGVSTRRRWATDLATQSVVVARDGGGPDERPVVARPTGDAVVAAWLAARRREPLVLLEDGEVPRPVAGYLRDRAVGGFAVGTGDAVPTRLRADLSRTVAGAR